MKQEEAIERIKARFDKWALDDEDMKAIQTLVPELAETEDERIRKELIEFIQWSVDRRFMREDFHQAKRPSEWIAWLEKQKDASKAIEAVERVDKYIDEHLANAHDMKDSNPDKKYYRGWDDALGEMARILQDVYSGEKQKEQKPIISEDAIREGVAHFGITQYQIDNWLKKHINVVEQNPAEWSEEDEKMIETICKEGDLKPSEQHWLKNLSERFNLQPKVEWSEEDEKRIQRICGFLWKNRKGDTDTIYQIEKDADWLKSLRPQSKDEIYKEKDEAFKLGKHQLAIKFMNYLDENRPEGKMGLSNRECEDIDKAFKGNDWEKIMRYANKYSWKPSEEQMKALNALNCHGDLSYVGQQNQLISLYNDLKKLM